ncbi:MAG: hypothetical protein H0T73_10625 [Ardenticatenales bacterium]|nr:hypothetical protein [Ardenticatenales bacterium]
MTEPGAAKIRVLIVDDLPQAPSDPEGNDDAPLGPEIADNGVSQKHPSFFDRLMNALFKLPLPPQPPPPRQQRRWMHPTSSAEMLAGETAIQVVATGYSALQGLELARQHGPEIVLWAISEGIPPAQHAPWIAALQKEMPTTSIIIVINKYEFMMARPFPKDTTMIRDLMLAGVKEFLIKPPCVEQLVASIRRVAQSSKR